MGCPKDRIVPEKPCAWCKEPYKPADWKTYRNPESCCNKTCAMKLRCAKHPEKTRQLMIAAKKHAVLNAMKRSRKRIEGMVSADYGPLTARDVQMFNLGAHYGYRRGASTSYKRGYRDAMEKTKAA